MRVVEQSRFANAFTFQYSIREGTPAATMPNQVPKEVVQERFDRLIELQHRISLEENQRLVGTPQKLLVSVDEGKKDDATHRLTGRAEDGRLVHFSLPEGNETPRPGDFVEVKITRGAPSYLVADSTEAVPVVRTRAGDAWDAAQAESCGTSGGGEAGGRAVNLGLPTLRIGAPGRP